jgi:exodeoxyribonuclease V alpha subunit
MRYWTTAFDGIQVISPSRKGEAGTELLNLRLQSANQSPVAQKERKGKCRRRISARARQGHADKKQTTTSRGRSTARTEAAFSTATSEPSSLLEAKKKRSPSILRESITEYDFSQCDELELAYAVTVHKAQGSEYPIVIIPLYRYTPKLLTRNLLYTAVTRAQAMMILVGDEEVSRAMIDNDRRAKRYTGLGHFLENYENG